MQFYKIECQLSTNEIVDNENVLESYEMSYASRRAIFDGSKDYYDLSNKKSFFFFSSYDFSHGVQSVVGGLITNDNNFCEESVKEYFDFLKLDTDKILCEETTFQRISNLLNRAERNNFIDEPEEILEEFEIIRLRGRSSAQYGENLISGSLTKKDIYGEAERKLFSASYKEELDRIFTKNGNRACFGHPVHYFLQTDDKVIRKDMSRNLMEALYSNGRLKNKRYCYTNIGSALSLSENDLAAIYTSLKGGAFVLRFENFDISDGENASGILDTIETVCSIAKLFRNTVLTIFCFPRSCDKLKTEFYRQLSSVSIIELSEDYVPHDKAKKYLREKAKENGLKPDEVLYANITDEDNLLTANLNYCFDEWMNNKLKTTVYSQYKNIATVDKNVFEEKPKGSAFSELDEMIGLTEAKKLIKRIINYFKLQKLYTENGIDGERPSLHMVFTGNPGTAKTSVARLFARILNENGLLSTGKIIEVGRSDLVGKYVGWTANIIKNKFKEASGGVLFIDEAYSLVDGRDGSYGDEAINTIVQEMENRRFDTVVIFAGYTDKMEQFLNKNPGLRSRIAFHVPFPDYNADELCSIAKLIASKKGISIDQIADEKLRTIFSEASKNADFGNGRFARNLIEQARMAQSDRLAGMEWENLRKQDITTLRAEDIDNSILAEKKQHRTIGFI